MKQKWLLLLTILPSFEAPAQSNCDCFDRLHNLAVYYYYYKDTTQYINTLKDAVSFLDTTQAGEYFPFIATAYASLKQYDSAILYYTRAVEWGYDIDNIRNDMSHVYNLMDTNKLKRINLEQRAKTDFDLYSSFMQQGALDQFVRGDIFFPESGRASIPPCKKSVLDTLITTVDDSTFEFVKYILENYQYPTQHQLGFFPMYFNVFLMHVTAEDNENSRYIFKKLEELNKTCNLPDKSRILFYKERQMWEHDKGYCGLWGGLNKIENINKADSIRFLYNQVRLKEQVAGRKQILPKEYNPTPYPKNYFCLKKYQIQ